MDASSDRYTSSLTNSMSGKSHQITQTTLDRIQQHNKTWSVTTCTCNHDEVLHRLGYKNYHKIQMTKNAMCEYKNHSATCVESVATFGDHSLCAGYNVRAEEAGMIQDHVVTNYLFSIQLGICLRKQIL